MAGRYGLEIRGADAGDAAGLAELLRGLAPVAPAPLTPAVVSRRLERLREAGATVLLAVDWGQPSGVAVVAARPALQHEAVASLDLLWVAPDDRRRGVGRLLVKAAAQAARQGGAAALLWTAPDAAARSFAEASGFEARGDALARPLRKRGD